MTRISHWTLGATLAWLLACGGLIPVDLDDLDGVVGDAPADEVDAEPPAPEELFVFLDPDEEALTGAPSCPAGTSVIRYPRGGHLHVYCASHNGTKNGTWSRWRGRKLVETRTYVDGLQDGRSTTWEDGRKRTQSTWRGDRLEGDHAEWDAEGTLLVRGVYEAGERHGRFIETTVAEDGSVTFGGTCYDEGAETWRTDDPVAFVTDPCASPERADDSDEDEVATLR